MARGGLTYGQLETAFRRRNFSPLYFLYGEEQYLIDSLQDLLVEHALEPGERDFNLDILYGAEVEVEQALAVCASYPVMAARRLVIIRDFEKMKGNVLFKSYAERPNPTAVVALVCRVKPNLSAHPYRALKEKAVAAEIKPLSASRVPGWIAGHVEGQGMEIAPRACEMLADFVGTDLQVAAAEIDKLASFVGDRKRIEEDDVIRASGQTREFNVFELQRAVGERDYARALTIAERLLQQTTNARGEAIRAVTILASYFTKLWKLTVCQGRRLGEKEMAQQAGVSPYFIKEYIHSLQKYDIRSIERALGLLLATDYELKGGAPRSETLIMQLMLNQLVSGKVFA
jgi:DNA polymerase-3 subunit delta